MPFFIHILFVISNWIPSMLSHNVIFGKGKIFHFGPMGVAIISSYGIVITLKSTGSFALAFLVGLVCALLISAVFAWLSVKLEPDALGVITLAMHIAILNIAINWTSLTRGALGIPGVPRLSFFSSNTTLSITMAVVAVLWIIFMLYLDRSSFGRQISALAEHEWYAKSIGISKIKINLIAFFIYALGMTIVAFFSMQYLTILHPNDFMFPAFIFYITCELAGKPGSVLGVTLAIVLLTILKEGLRFMPIPTGLTGPLELIIFGVILFVAVWWRRDSVFPNTRSV
ncbi:branched-chain amino acid ABC transporter permease [Candidatus Peribacteria bacterium]|jgi:branched-chain amino acid transport system permease protein|nr:branched-chain amino acid ABC transporter permease [Candidatus Peribacteria bacterium]MBT4020943.1 branched-chain amino acid ABC transporter permease [Candidatus Peribacteria bacterium]MBT4240293.1 branched-chain amino acid ABC transporter permease [Candidatus Peribacteria bacterium]MBT4473908.1 branched-chain amino acid ABC transporter permease [Candidatus Peribacteria bacterium]